VRAGVETKTSLPIEDEERGLGPGTRLGAFFDASHQQHSRRALLIPAVTTYQTELRSNAITKTKNVTRTHTMTCINTGSAVMALNLCNPVGLGTRATKALKRR
jgi:hypothetical protein